MAILKPVKCEVCGTYYEQHNLSHHLHPTNWMSVNLRTADVCSDECKELFTAKLEALHKLRIIDDKIEARKKQAGENETLKTIRDILDDPDKLPDDKLEDIEDLFISRTDSDWG